jgi:hypothetical protein
MRHASTRAAAALLAAALLTAACSSSPAAHSTSSASATNVHAHAIALCNANNRALATAAQHAFSAGRPTPATWRTFMLKTGLPLVQKRFEQLTTLDPASFGPISDAAHAAVKTARQHPTILSPATRAPFDHLDSLLAARGLSACTVGT